MKPSGISNPKIVVMVALAQLVLALLMYFIVFPLAVPTGLAGQLRALDEMRTILLTAGFVLGTVASLVVLFVALYLRGGDNRIQTAIDALRLPVMVLNNEGRYNMINTAAENALGLHRAGDIGKPLHPDVAEALAEAAENGAASAVVSLREAGDFRVMSGSMPGAGGSRRQVVILVDASDHARMRDALGDLNQAMRRVNAHALKVSGSSQALNQGASRQSNSLAAISASLDEFSKKIQGNTESADKGSRLATQAREAAERSGGEIAHALSAMNDVQDAGVRIARIVKLIDDIAFQTNLLALNAAVEAARAGRQGKGFAVVAEEVRNLAGRSARAAKDTASMVEDVTVRIGNASAYISKLEEMLRNIVQDSIRMADASAGASATSNEQAAAILLVNQELGQMNSLTYSTKGAADQTASAVKTLCDEVEVLRTRIDALNRECGFDDSQDAALPAPASVPTINLLDEPPPSAAFGARGDDAYFSGYTEQIGPPLGGRAFRPDDDDDHDKFDSIHEFTTSFKQAAADTWDLRDVMEDENEPSLSALLQSDGYTSKYDNLFQTGASTALSGDNPPEHTTPDGDRILRPNQNIQLDDTEFGRY